MKWTLLFLIISSCQLGFHQKRILTHEPVMKLCFLGDVGKDSPTQGQVALALQDEQCHAVFFAGDIIYPKGLQFAGDKEGEEKFFKYYRPLTNKDHRPQLHIALGNHDYQSNPDVWTRIAEQDPSVYAPARYFSEDFGGVCVTTLDTQLAIFPFEYIRQKGQSRWLSQEKKKFKDCTVKIALGHHPYRYPRVRKFLKDEVFGVFDYYIAGHEHFMSYERIKDQTEQFITGAGGTPDHGHLPGYLTMTIEKKAETFEVLTEINKISPRGQVTREKFRRSF